MSAKVAIVADGGGTRGHATAAVLAPGGRTAVAAGRNEHALRDLPGNCERSTRPGGRG
jgi:NADP-dependent 3-hydroxy acid dehydrogenase YdfG